LRAGKPILAHDSALAHARSGAVPGPAAGTGEPPTTVQAWLDQVRPADFGDGPAH
jgi:hypothetical protein